MREIILNLAPVALIMLITSAPVFGFGGSSGMPSPDPMEPVVTEKMKKLTIPIRMQDSGEIQQISLFSDKYAQTPVALVNEEPITLKEFTLELATMHSGMANSGKQTNQSYTKMLDRLIAIKLVKQEALNIGFDQTPPVQKKIEDFKLKTLVQLLITQQMINLQPDEAVVEELYKQMALEAKLLTYRFHDQADAVQVLTEVQAGKDFKALSDKMVSEGKAEGGVSAEYAKLTDLFPSAARSVFKMEIGEVSEIYQPKDGFLVFRLEDRRVFDDPEIRQEAKRKALKQKISQVQTEYFVALIDKYATFDEEIMEVLDFDKIVEQEPNATTLTTLSRFDNDQRVMVAVSDGDNTTNITVADVAGELKGTMYHGVDKKISPQQLNNEKITLIQKKLNLMTAKMEAERLNIHTSEVYLERVKKYEEEVLFDTFLAKAVLPGLTVAEEDVRRYYYSHLDDYSSPLMVQMKSLVFTDIQSAQEAQKKLRDGSDFKWVSANMTGLAASDNEDILNLGGSILSVTALPEDLHELVETAKQGDIIVYAGPANLYYTLIIDTAYPPKAKLYAEVRQEAGKVVYGQKINEALEEWVFKLKEVYETEVFIVQNDH